MYITQFRYFANYTLLFHYSSSHRNTLHSPHISHPNAILTDKASIFLLKRTVKFTVSSWRIVREDVITLLLHGLLLLFVIFSYCVMHFFHVSEMRTWTLCATWNEVLVCILASIQNNCCCWWRTKLFISLC